MSIIRLSPKVHCWPLVGRFPHQRYQSPSVGSGQGIGQRRAQKTAGLQRGSLRLRALSAGYFAAGGYLAPIWG